MEKNFVKHFTCIMCPLGCNLTVEKKGEEIIVTGNECIRGKYFGIDEVTNPKRVITSLIKTKNGIVSVKTTAPVPKNKVFEIIDEIKKIKIEKAKMGDTILKNVLNIGVDIVITSE